jgi:hypothetical protein
MKVRSVLRAGRTLPPGRYFVFSSVSGWVEPVSPHVDYKVYNGTPVIPTCPSASPVWFASRLLWFLHDIMSVRLSTDVKFLIWIQPPFKTFASNCSFSIIMHGTQFSLCSALAAILRFSVNHKQRVSSDRVHILLTHTSTQQTTIYRLLLRFHNVLLYQRPDGTLCRFFI